MRKGTIFATAMGLVALVCSCDGDDGGNGTGGSGSGGRVSTGGAGTGGNGAGGNGTGGGGTGGSGPGAECTVLARGLPVSAGPATTPSALWTGDRYAVAYTSTWNHGNIQLAFIDQGGHKTSDLTLAGGPEASSYPTLAPAGTGLVVLWQDEIPSGSAIRGQRVGLDGKLQGGVFTIAYSDAEQSWPIAARTEGGFAVAWMSTDTAHLAFASESGSVGNQVTIDGGLYPSVAAAAGDVALAWSVGANIGFARTGPTSGPLDAALLPAGAPGLTRVAATGSRAYVAWEDLAGGAGAEQVFLVGIEGEDTFTQKVAVPAAQGSANWPAVAWTGDRIAVAYYQFRDAPPAVYLELFTPDLTRLGIDLVVSGTAPARFPAVAMAGDEIGVVYAENGGRVYLSRISCP